MSEKLFAFSRTKNDTYYKLAINTASRYTDYLYYGHIIPTEDLAQGVFDLLTDALLLMSTAELDELQKRMGTPGTVMKRRTK